MDDDDGEDEVSCWKKVKKRVPVCTAVFLMFFCSSLYFVFIATYFFLQTEIYWKVLVILQALVAIFMFVNFLCATFCDPGFFPKSAEPEDTANDGPTSKTVTINRLAVKCKWCSTCKFYRPPRCSHCSVCDHCVEKFDHHCPWVNNCIGVRNYRYFFGFVTGLTAHMISILTLVVFYLVTTWQRKDFAFVVCWIVIGVLLVAFPLVVSLTVFHIYLVSRGRTTNEQVTGKFTEGYNPFDLGFMANCTTALCGPQYPSYMDFAVSSTLPARGRSTEVQFSDLSKAQPRDNIFSGNLPISERALNTAPHAAVVSSPRSISVSTPSYNNPRIQYSSVPPSDASSAATNGGGLRQHRGTRVGGPVPAPSLQTSRPQNQQQRHHAMSYKQLMQHGGTDNLAPDLSDMEFDVAGAAGAGGDTHQHQTAGGKCSRPISLINAMQTCDLVAASTSGHIASGTATTPGASGTIGSTYRQIAAQSSPTNQPRRQSGPNPTSSVDLGQDEIFEISV